MQDLFIAHIAAMDAFARALTIADNIMAKSPYMSMRKERYASFGSGDGKAFEQGKLTLEDLRNIAMKNGEPGLISGKQELYEAIINMYI
jgi:xylose isomerase